MADIHTTAATILDGPPDNQVAVAYLELQRNPGRGMVGPAWKIQLAVPSLSGERAYRQTFTEAQTHATSLAPLVHRLLDAEAERDAAKDALYRAFMAQPEPVSRPAAHITADEPPF